jgi:hypothetical protein
MRMMRQQLEECETLYEQACLAINKEFAVQEAAAAELAALKRRDETDTHRLEAVVDSYMAVEEYRQRKTHEEAAVMYSPTRTASVQGFREAFHVAEKEMAERQAAMAPPVPLTLSDPEESSLHIQNLAKKLRLFKDMKDRYDNRLRKCATRLYRNGVKMKNRLQEHESDLAIVTRRAEVAEVRLRAAEKELRDVSRKLGKERELSRTAAAFAWEDAWLNRSEVEEYKDRVIRSRPVLEAAMCVEDNPLLNEMAHLLSNLFGAFTEEEEARIIDRELMTREEARCVRVNEFQAEMLAKSEFLSLLLVFIFVLVFYFLCYFCP